MKIVLIGNYGAANIGDELILLGIMTEFFSLYPDAEVSIMSADIEETRKFTRFYFPGRNISVFPRLPFGFRSFTRRILSKGILGRGSEQKIFAFFKEADIIFVGGGGLFADDESIKACPFWFTQSFPALLFKKPLITYGLGIGPIRGRLAQYFTKRLLKHADFLAVRDGSSMSALHKLLPQKKINLTLDPVFLLRSADLLARNPVHPEIPKNSYVALSLRDFSGWNEDLYKTFAQLLDFIIGEFGLNIVFLPFQTYAPSDNEIMNKIFVHVKKREYIICPKFESKNIIKNMQAIFSFVSNASFTLGMRLHSNLLSLILGTPFLPIIYSEKSKAFLRDNMPSLMSSALNFPDITLGEAAQRLQGFIQRLPLYKKEIKEISEKVYFKAKTDFGQLKNYLNKEGISNYGQ